MGTLRQRIVDEFQNIAGSHDDPDVYGGQPGDPGLIGPGSVSWEVNADLAAVAQAGLPAIVLEILHPSVIAGVQDLSTYRQDPFRRARTTLGYVLTTTFGNTEAATHLIEQVKSIHSRVTGTRPDGVAYRALDPELLAWVHTCIPWMIMRVFERTNRRLTPHERDQYLAEQAVIGRMAPRWARELTGFDRPSSLARRLVGPALQFDARRIRWAYGLPPYARLARERADGVGFTTAAKP